ncbi:uncharacterized protein LOC112093080 [Morus notabilis]|uniref:uncharacterized protein LOC112093080 n=1 Tax=Morus notabilis TaxID=981085 RepID=UPI000CED6460|nr:uncharacterized protein LOC112093080 [Morus notabilis]
MGIQKEQLEKTSRPLYGFTGDSVIPQGTIRLPITAGEKPRQVKFPTPNGVGEMKSNQYEARVAYSNAMCGYDQLGRQETRMVHQGLVEDIDPQIQEEVTWSRPVEQLVEVRVGEGIDSGVICHSLNVDPSYPPKRQKRRPMNPERYEALREKVDKLINNGFIRESHYPRWVSNPVLVTKPNGDWRTCIDFSDLNKACPKDGFPLPRID